MSFLNQLAMFSPIGFGIGVAANGGNIGDTVGQALNYDLTKGYNLTWNGPVANAVPTSTSDKPTPRIKLTDTYKPSQDDGTVYNGGGGFATGYATPNYAAQNADKIAQLQKGADTIQDGLNRLPSQLDIATANINSQYGQKNNELDSGFNQTKNQYDTSTTQNQQSFRTNKNSINDQASQGLRGLMRSLGAYGAVGSDLGVAGQAVSNLQSQQNAGAGQTYGQNQSSLDTNFGNYKNQFNNEKNKLKDWLTQNLNNAQSQSLTTKQTLLAKLADINGQMGAARGGSYSGSAQPYLDQANALSGEIDNLGKLNPVYTGITPVYNAPTLSSYNAGNPAEIGIGGNGTSASNMPLLALLAQQDKRRQGVL